jgi:hypothetical protein
MKQTFLVLAFTMAAAAAQAQQVSHFQMERVPHDQSTQVLFDKVVLDHAQVAVESRVTPNAPYSAESTNESIQTLADGNRIVHRMTTRVYRDSAGRTRRETLDADGQVVLVAIADPATGQNFVFDPKINRVVSRSVVKIQTDDANPGTTISHTTSGTTATSDEKVKVRSEGSMVHVESLQGGEGGNTFFFATTPHAKGQTEDLGQQTIEGVTATGKRTTTVIPAGAMGNEQPIKIVSEEWFSPELQVLVLTRHSDPRSGESTYRLTNITRTEPAKTLFEVPEKK